jgi:beta-xylosidase
MQRGSACVLVAWLVLASLVPYAPALAQPARNPILWADVPDPSVVRVDSVYYMTSTTMHMSPGVPVMRSTNLVDWKTIGYVYHELANADALFMRQGQNAYGRGTWASSLRHRDGHFYVVTFSYTTGETYVFTTGDVERGPWRKVSLGGLYHDPSLFFDDDGRVYLVYGAGDIRIVELTADARTVKPGGVDRVLIPKAGGIAGSAFYVPGEGSHVAKIGDRYYLFLIAWPRGGMRTELVYRADSLEGLWEGRIALEDDGIAQGGIVDTPDGRWYGLLFGDRGAVGRIPYLVPVTWSDGWPVFGMDGAVPDTLDVPSDGTGVRGIVASDEFGEPHFGPAWQWNHQPDGDRWSLTARPGWLRIENGRTARSLVGARNTLTQRTFGPRSSATTLLDAGGLADGDAAGLGILMEHYAWIGVVREGDRSNLVVTALLDGEEVETARVPLGRDAVHLRVDADFRDMMDEATFSYSLDGDAWTPIGGPFAMRYTLGHFMGARFGLFSYARHSPGGWADFDYLRLGGM